MSKSESELTAILRLGWPMVLTQLCIMASGFLDTAMAGQYNAADLAGVSVGGSILWPTFLLLSGLTMALTPIASQLRGGDRTGEVGHQIRQALWVCAVSATGLVLVLLNAEPLLRFAGVDPVARQIAVDYLQAVAWGVPAIVFYVALRNACEGLGQTRPPMLIAAGVLPVNAFFNYVLIYGELGFPQLGGAGCGWATAIAFWVQLLMMLVVVRRPFFRATGFLSHFEPPVRSTIFSIVRIGGPIGLTIFLEMAVYSVVSLLIASIGVNQVAGHSIAGNLNWLTFVIPMSIGSAASIRVGYHVGAGRLHMARSTSGLVYRFSIAYALVVSVLLVLLRYQLISIYTSDPEVIQIAANLLLFIAVYQIVDDSQAVTMGALRGYKDTEVPMYIGLVGYWLVALPLGHALSVGWLAPGLAPGVYGYWAGLTAGLTLVAISVGYRLWSTSGDEGRIRTLGAL